MVQSVPAEVAVERGHPSTKLTIADYELFPDDDLRHEIIDGEHYVTPSPVTQHQRISRNLLHLLQSHLDTNPSGEVFYAPYDVILTNTDIVVPDLLYVSRQRAHLITEKNLQGAPDLVIEILSPGTRRRDQSLKRDLYERAGVAEYWVVDPGREVIALYRRDGGHFAQAVQHTRPDHLTTPLMPGLELSVDKVLG